MAQTVLAMPNYNTVYDIHGITTINDIAALSINAFADTSNQPQNLVVGASSNIEIEAYESTNVTFSDKGSLSLYNFANGDYANKYKILNINNDSVTTTINAPQMRLDLQGTDPQVTTGLSLTSFYIDNDFQKIATSMEGFMFDDYVFLNSNLVVNSDIVGHQNLAVGGNIFSKTTNLYKNFETTNDTDLSQVAYAFFINTNNQLELLRYEKFGTSNVSTRQTRINLWGDGSNKGISGIYNFGQSNYTVLQEYGGLSTIRNVNSNGFMTGVSGGQNIFKTDDSNIYLLQSNVGIGTALPTVPLDVNGAIRATTYCNLFLDDLTSTSIYYAPTASNLSYVWENVSYLSNSLIPKSSFSSNLVVALSNALFSGAVGGGGGSGSNDLGTYMMAFATSNDLYPNVNYVISLGQSLSNAVYSGELLARDIYSSNLATITSNVLYPRSQYACNLTITMSNTLYSKSIFASNTSAFASNKSIFSSNVVVALSNIIYTSGITGNSNLSNYVDGVFASNLSIATSNLVYQNSNLLSGVTGYGDLSNIVYETSNTLYPSTIFSSNKSAWASNAIGTAVRTTGATMSGNITIVSSNVASPPIYGLSNNITKVDIALAVQPNQFSTDADSNDLVIRNTSIQSKIHLQQGSNAAALTINSNNTVGISTNAPVEALHVAGKIYSTTQILVSSNDTVSAPAYAFYQDSNTGISHPANDSLGLVTGGTERVRIDSSGYVGINTSNPTVSLDVVGQIKTSSGLVINSSTYTDSNLNAWSNTVYYSSNLAASSSNDLYPQATFGSNTAVFASNLSITNSNALYPQATFASNLAVTSSNNLYPQATFGSNTALFASNLSISNSNVLYPQATFASNLAVTSSNALYPQALFSSNLAVSNSNSLLNYVPRVGGTMNLAMNSNFNLYKAGSLSYNLYNNLGGSVNFGLAFNQSNFSSFASNNDFVLISGWSNSRLLMQVADSTIGLVINSNNFVGIGTVSPSERLSVNGKIYSTNQVLADSNDTVSAPAFSFLQNSNTGLSHPANDTLGLVTAGTERVRIDSSGRVGVGISNPSVPLDVVGQIKTSSGLVINSSTYTDTNLNAWSNTAYFASNLSITNSNALYPQATFASNKAVFASNALLNYLPLAGGAVLGSTSFLSNIVLSAPLNQAASNNLIYSTAGNLSISAESYLDFIMDNNSNNFNLGNNMCMRFGSGSTNTNSNFTEFMRLTALGRLGIGTSNPTAALDVAGDVRVASNLSVIGNLNVSGTTTTIDATSVTIKDNMIQVNNGAAYNVGLQAGIEVNRGTGYSNYYFVFDEATDYFRVGTTGQLQTVATREDSPAVNTVPYYDSTGARYVSTSTFAFSNNRLGVGTIAPSETMHVAGKIYSTSQVLADSNDSSNAPAFSFMGDSNTGVSHPSNNTLGFTTGGSEKLRIDSQGYVGIGLSNPSVALEVNGGAKFASNIVSGSIGTVSIPFVLSTGFFDLSDTSNVYIFSEPGNTSASMFNGGFFNGSNCSQENISLTRAKMVIRCVSLNTGSNATNTLLNICCYNSNTNSNVVLSTMTCKDAGSHFGYTTNVSGFFSLSNTNMPLLGIQLASSNTSFRIGPTSIWFS